MAMLRHLPNLTDLIAPECDSGSDSCDEAAPMAHGLCDPSDPSI